MHELQQFAMSSEFAIILIVFVILPQFVQSASV